MQRASGQSGAAMCRHGSTGTRRTLPMASSPLSKNIIMPSTMKSKPAPVRPMPISVHAWRGASGVFWRLRAEHTAPRVAAGYGERTSVVVHGGSCHAFARWSLWAAGVPSARTTGCQCTVNAKGDTTRT